MKKNLAKIILTVTLTVVIAGTMTTVAQAHHGHSSNRASQDTTGYQGGSCHGGGYCDPNPAFSNAGYNEARKHHADFYCGSREDYYSRRGGRIHCRY